MASPDRSKAKVLVADAQAMTRRRLAREVLEGGFEVLTAPELPAAATMLRTTRVEVVVCTLALLGGSDGYQALSAADPGVQLLLGAAAHDMERACAVAFGRACLPFLLPMDHPSWLHLALDRAIAQRGAREGVQQREASLLDGALRDLSGMPYKDAKAALLKRFDEAYLLELLDRHGRREAAERSGLADSSFRELLKRVAPERRRGRRRRPR